MEGYMNTYETEVVDRSYGDAFPNGQTGTVGAYNIMETLAGVESDQEYAVDKVLNLQILAAEVASRHPDIEALILHNSCNSDDSVKKAFEFDALYGILDSEVKELDKFIEALQIFVIDVDQKISEEESSKKIEEKLHRVKLSLKQMQDIIAIIRTDLLKFEKTIDLFHEKDRIGEDIEQVPVLTSNIPQWRMHTDEQPGQVLQMLEKSDANELELESRLGIAHSKSCFLEKLLDEALERMLANETSNMLYQNISKELSTNICTIQLGLSALIDRDVEIVAQLCESSDKLSIAQRSLLMLQDVRRLDDNGDTEKLEIQGFDALSLQQKFQEAELHFLECFGDLLVVVEHTLQKMQKDDKRADIRGVGESDEKLMESDAQMQIAERKLGGHNTLQSNLSTLEYIVKKYQEKTLKAENKIVISEADNASLRNANMILRDDLKIARSRENSLEGELSDLKSQLDRAKASNEAYLEQIGWSETTTSDMEHTIEDLKGKVRDAESQADNAEAKCSTLEESILELEKDNKSLRNRIRSLEDSLCEVNNSKISTAKCIGIKVKSITELAEKIKLERERLHLQISTLTKKNKILVQKCKGYELTINDRSHNHVEDELNFAKTELSTVASSACAQVSPTAADVVSEVEESETLVSELGNDADMSSETVRTLQPSLPNWRYLVPLLMAAVAAFLYLIHQSGDAVA